MFHRHLGQFPDILLCVSVSAVATLLERLEVSASGHAWLEAAALAILIGAIIRTIWFPGKRWLSRIEIWRPRCCLRSRSGFSAVLSAHKPSARSPRACSGASAIVMLIAIGMSYGIGKLLGLPHRMATLVARGNSICSNSAIAAVTPGIGADGEISPHLRQYLARLWSWVCHSLRCLYT